MPKRTNPMPLTENGKISRKINIDFKSATEKGGLKVDYEATLIFLSDSAMLMHAADHVKWQLQKLANKGEFPTGRRVSVEIAESGIELMETEEDLVNKILAKSDEERDALRTSLERQLKAVIAAQSVR